MNNEEMYEEHLEDETSTISSATTAVVNVPMMEYSAVDQNNHLTRRKLLVLMATHLQNFQKAIILNRRRSQQRQRSRQSLLRAFYVQQLMQVETNFIELLPVQRMLNIPQTENTDAVVMSVQPNLNNTNTSDDDRTTIGSTTQNTLRFYEDVMQNYTDHQWLTTFRMSKSTFQRVCIMMREAFQPVGLNAPFKGPITLEKRIALALYSLASGEDYRSIALLFDISRASVCKFVKRFAQTVVEKLAPSVLCMPQSEPELNDIRTAFHQASNMPAAVIGVLGICQIPVNYLMEDKDISNPGTIILETLVDDRLLFRKVVAQTKMPNTFLAEPNDVSKLPSHLINGRRVPSFIVTTPSNSQPTTYYPLRPWLMHQYDEPVAPYEYDFNEAVENLLAVKERALRRLFARWKILLRKNYLDTRTLEIFAIACCSLHNLLEESNEGFLEEWADGIDVSKFTVRQFTHASENGNAVAPETNDAIAMRDFLARTISSTEM